jgi:hypothetical protein
MTALPVARDGCACAVLTGKCSAYRASMSIDRRSHYSVSNRLGQVLRGPEFVRQRQLHMIRMCKVAWRSTEHRMRCPLPGRELVGGQWSHRNDRAVRLSGAIGTAGMANHLMTRPG